MKTLFIVLVLFPLAASSAWHLDRMNIPQAWTVTQGAGVTVGIVGGGTSHDAIVEGAIKEVAPAAATTFCIMRRESSKNYADCIKRLTNDGVEIINVSYIPSWWKGVVKAADYARSNGVLVVWSGGRYISGVPQISSIVHSSGTDENDMVASWSSTGAHIDVSAPGVNIQTPVGTYSGNSLSCANVSGVVALVKSAHPSYSPAQVEAAIEQSAVDLGPPGWDESYGWGRVDAYAALQASPSPQSASDPPTQSKGKKRGRKALF